MSRALDLAHRAREAASQARFDEAGGLVLEAEAAAPRGRAWLQLALASLDTDDQEACARALERALDSEPSNPAVHLFRALLHHDRGEFQEALQALGEARRLSPQNQAIPTARALVHLGQDRLGEALQFLAPAEGRKPVDLSVSPPLVGRLAVAVEKRLLPLELPSEDTLLASPRPAEPPACGAPAPGSAAGGGWIGRQVDHWREERRGRAAMNEAWDRRIQDPAQRRALLEGAVDAFRAAREADPGAFRASYHLGEALYFLADFGRRREDPLSTEDLGLLREAEACFRKSLKDDSSNAYVLHYLARTAFLQRRFSEAEGRWRKALEGFEKFPEAHYGLGLALLARGREREARHYLLLSFMSDLHLLRERLADLGRVYQSRPDLVETPAEFPLREFAEAPSGEEAPSREEEPSPADASPEAAEEPPPEARPEPEAAEDPPPEPDPTPEAAEAVPGDERD